jgi:hypothetical protein
MASSHSGHAMEGDYMEEEEMTTSGNKREKRADTTNAIVVLVLGLAVVCWLVSSETSGRSQSAASAGMNGIQEQEMQYGPSKDGHKQR